ncbi:TPA: ubiquitin-specific protease ubp14, variant 4 [Trebouxia sp. C0004]
MSIHRANTMFVDQLVDMGFPRVSSEKAVFYTHNCGVEPAVHWLMEHSEDTNLDIPLNAVRYMRLVVGRLLQDSHPVLTVRLRIFTCLQSTSGRQDYSRAETVLGVAAAGQSVMGMPSDISHVVHPDGRKTPAMFVEVSADCKVSSCHAACGMHSSMCWSIEHTCWHLQVVLIVVRSLHMSPGKIGAQCAHAAVGLYKVIVTNRAPWLSAWEVGSFAVL